MKTMTPNFEQSTAAAPALHQPALTYGLDYYKPTMSQLAYEQEPDAEVTFTFRNRGQQRLADYIDPAQLQERFDDLRGGWNGAEVRYLGGITINGGELAFRPGYLNYLQDNPLPEVTVRHDAATDDLAIQTTGPWALASFWETQVMADVSETYFANYMEQNRIAPAAVYDEGNRRLDDYIRTMQQHPDIQMMDFGTRRRFSLDWQRHVLGRLATECPDNLLGTSNVGLAMETGLKAIGTFAHEMPMGYAGLADARGQDIRASHGRFLNDWYARYGTDYSITLTDTFTTDFFFDDFTTQQAADWRGVRHDSGDPFIFGNRLIDFYRSNGIDPTQKACVFSDGLDKDMIVGLHQEFGGRLADRYGIGTKLTNNLGLKALNMVMKATHVRDTVTGGEADTVKLSDDAGKHTGPAGQVRRYQHTFTA